MTIAEHRKQSVCRDAQIMTNIDSIISPAKYHRSLNGFLLAEARGELGLTQLAFSILCGWSRETQCKLEHGEVEVKIEIAETIGKVLQERYGKR